MRALQYDREQYNKGYEDGYNDAIDIFQRDFGEKIEEYIKELK